MRVQGIEHIPHSVIVHKKFPNKFAHPPQYADRRQNSYHPHKSHKLSALLCGELFNLYLLQFRCSFAYAKVCFNLYFLLGLVKLYLNFKGFVAEVPPEHFADSKFQECREFQLQQNKRDRRLVVRFHLHTRSLTQIQEGERSAARKDEQRKQGGS